MEKSQKEYFLNEQIKAAQKELGEIGEEKSGLMTQVKLKKLNFPRSFGEGKF
ncbi:MAG: hypothetical protein CM15mP12_7050 [Gammaproteobacteria bacterium]|nr:MAG: hypothetical protein CM15mP12_7050 [Gammaproteobacteria bacterium]